MSLHHYTRFLRVNCTPSEWHGFAKRKLSIVAKPKPDCFIGTELGVVDLTAGGSNNFLWDNIHRVLFKVGAYGRKGAHSRRKKVHGRRYLSLPRNVRYKGIAGTRLVLETLHSVNTVTPGHYAVRSGLPVLDIYSNTTDCTVRLRAQPQHSGEIFETLIHGKTTAVRRHELGEEYFPITQKHRPQPY